MASKLAAKLASVMAGVDHIPKRGRNKFHGYDYATEADVSDAVRARLTEQGVATLVSVLPETVTIKETTTAKGRTEFIYFAVFEITFVDGDTGEALTSRMPGAGQDSGDKGPYKAATGAIKYALMKTFLIPTGDDPELDERSGRPGQEPHKPRAVKPTKGADKPKPATKPDAAMKRLWAIAGERKLDDETVHVLAYKSYKVTSLKDLKPEQLATLANGIEGSTDTYIDKAVAESREAYLAAAGLEDEQNEPTAANA